MMTSINNLHKVPNGIQKNNWLFIVPTDSVQGAEHIVQSLATHIHGLGGHCTVLILTNKHGRGWAGLERTMDVRYFPFSSYPLGILWLLPYTVLHRTTFKKVRYCFSSQTLVNGTVGLAKRLGLLPRTKVVVRESNSIFDLLQGFKLKIYALFYALGYKGSSLVICQTGYMAAQLRLALPRLTKRLNIQVLPNPFDFNAIGNKKGDLLPEFKGKKILVAAGRLAHAKGFDVLIDAFWSLQARHKDLHLIILGEGKDRSSLSAQIARLGLGTRVHLPGYVPNVYPYFKVAVACVLSSRIEGFPNVLLQMMSQNTKVVATLSAGDIDAIPGLFTCPTENATLLKEAIEKALESHTENNAPLFETYLSERTLSAFYTNIVTLTN